MSISAALKGLVPAGMGVGLCRFDQAEPLWGGEALPRAVPARVAEFAAGRTAARQAMVGAGAAMAAIPMAADRAPIWPQGLCGSISHSGDLAVAVVGRSPIGIDLELREPLPADLAPLLLTAVEAEWLARTPDPLGGARLVFAAKEAAFKCQYPLTRALLEPQEMEVIPDPDSLRPVRVRLAEDRGAGMQFTLRVACAQGFWIVVALPDQNA